LEGWDVGLAATDYFGGDPYPGIFDGIFTIATNFADHLPWRRVLYSTLFAHNMQHKIL